MLYEPSHAAPESLVASVGVDFEKELRVIYGRARSIDDVTADLQHLRDTMESRRRAFDEVQERASGLIETRLDDAVRQVLASYQSSLPSELEGLDRDVDLLTQSYFDGAGISYVREQQSGRVAYQVQPSAALPEGYREGFVAGAETDGSAPSQCAVGRDAGLFSEHGLENELECRRRGGVHRGRCTFARVDRGQTSRRSARGQSPQVAAGRSVDHRLAAADEGADHDHLHHDPAGQSIITSETFTALLLMAVASTMLTVPVVAPKLQRLKSIVTQAA